jgi:hypothetical protein
MTRRSLLFCTVLAACGESVAPIDTPEVRAVVGQPGTGTFTLTTDLLAGAEIEAIGADDAGRIVVASEGRALVLEAGALEAREYYRGEGDPETIGAIHAIAPRAAGGAFIGSDHGLFLLESLYVVRSPLLDGEKVHDVFEQVAGPLAGVWLATDHGLLRLQGENLTRLTVEGLADRATAIAIEKNGGRGIAVMGDGLVILEPEGDGLVSQRPGFTTGVVHGVAAGDGTLYAATDRGLYVHGATTDASFLHFALAADMSAAPAVKSVTVDVTGAAWASTGARLFLVEAEQVTAFDAPADIRGLRLDSLGDLWLAAGDQIAQRGRSALGERVTFTADVKPWVTQRCSACHRNQIQDFENYEVLKALATKALSRVRSGDMPRCTGSLRCAPEDRLQPADYAVLEQWLRYGLPE